MTKIEALAKHLGDSVKEISQSSFDENLFNYMSQEYLVLTDAEADELAKQSILDSVWAFNADFLAAHSGIDSDVIKAIQENGRCEDNNAVLLKLIDDKDHFVNDAISSDGRGHLMNFYDGNEHESGDFYIYRTN